MNARNYRTKTNQSTVDFPAIKGLGQQQDFTQTEPPVIIDNKVHLKITKKLIIVDFYDNKEHHVLTVQSIYEIPIYTIQSRENIYEYYQDATMGLSEVYDNAQKEIPLPDISFPTQPIDSLQREIDGIFYLINSLN